MWKVCQHRADRFEILLGGIFIGKIHFLHRLSDENEAASHRPETEDRDRAAESDAAIPHVSARPFDRLRLSHVMTPDHSVHNAACDDTPGNSRRRSETARWAP